MDVSILTATPVILGVLTCTEEEQAIKRSTGDNNHGVDWGKRYRMVGHTIFVLVLLIMIMVLLMVMSWWCCCCCWWWWW